MTEPFPAEASGPRSSHTARAASPPSELARASTLRVKLPAAPGALADHSMWRRKTSSGSRRPLRTRLPMRFRAMAVASVVDPGGESILGGSGAGSDAGI